MRYAIISDIHGNLAALNAVLNHIDDHFIDSIICLGDMVGYYSEVNECIEIIKERATFTVAGNHDYAAIGKIDYSNFSPPAHEAIEFTQRVLTKESKMFLEYLPLTITHENILFVHGSPYRPHCFEYVFAQAQNTIKAAFDAMKVGIGFIGHTHLPQVFIEDEICATNLEGTSFTFEPSDRFIVNVGSVGQPRNGDIRASYAIYDSDDRTLSLEKVPYDITITQDLVEKNMLPPFLSKRLEKGI